MGVTVVKLGGFSVVSSSKSSKAGYSASVVVSKS